MARIYYPKKTSTRLLEGALAGLVGGAVAILLMMLLEALLPDRSWFYTPSLVGTLFLGDANNNTTHLGAALIVGLLVMLVLYAIMGMGFVSYRPVLLRFPFGMVWGGAIFGLFDWFLLFFFFFKVVKPVIPDNMNNLALAVASAIGGGVMGWWLWKMAK